MATKKINLTDKSGIVDAMVHALAKKGSVRLVHFGQFSIKTIKGGKRFDFKKRAVIPKKPYKQIIFRPSRAIQEMLREGKMASE